MTPTDANLREVAEFRLRNRPWWITTVLRRADYYVTRRHHPAETAGQAIEWAMHLLDPIGSVTDQARAKYVEDGGCPEVAPHELDATWCNDRAGHDGPHWCLQEGDVVRDSAGFPVVDERGQMTYSVERREWR